jgi:Soluble lytic murein transglycosylase and related regulatory proteins (some contain LysM/invasin domains)
MQRIALAASIALMGITLSGSAANAQDGYYTEMTQACAVYGCSPDYLYSVMMCESGGDPNAVGPHGELGIMQVDPRYWGYMSSSEQIWFAAQHLGKDIYWACA